MSISEFKIISYYLACRKVDEVFEGTEHDVMAQGKARRRMEEILELPPLHIRGKDVDYTEARLYLIRLAINLAEWFKWPKEVMNWLREHAH
jgi:hypothetical protein